MTPRHRVIGKARNTDEIADVLRLRKDQLQLSDAALDALCGFASGHVGKLLGPARVRGLGRFSLDVLADALGLSFQVYIDPEKVLRFAKHYEQRNSACITVRAHKLSRTAMAQAKLEIYRAVGSRGGKASAERLTPAQRSKRARRAALAMHRKRRQLAEAA